MSAAAIVPAEAWRPVVYVEAPAVGGIPVGRPVELPPEPTKGAALAAAVLAMETTPGAVSCSALRVAGQHQEGGAS